MNRLLLFFLLISSSLSAQTFQADFKVDTTYGCGPVTVHFTDMSTSALPITSRRWDFGDGTSSTDVSPVHTYTKNGRYQVGYYVINSNGAYSNAATNVDAHAIKVYPILNPRYHEYQLCSDSIQLTSNSFPLLSSMQTYLWSNGKTTPDIKVKSAGTYTVQVTGCGKTLTDSITTASGTASLIPSNEIHWWMDSTYIDISLNVPYPSNAYSKVTWSWGDSSITSLGSYLREYHYYVTPGIKKITASVRLNSDISPSCADTMATYNFNLREPYVNHNGWNKHDTTLLQGHVLRIFDTKNSGADHYWNSDFSYDPLSVDSGLAITSPGTYTVRIAKNEDFIYDIIHVKLDTTSLHARIAVDGKNCSTVNFTDSSFSNISSITYAEWSFGDGSIDSSRNYSLTHTYAKDSTYSVRLIVKNAIGMRDTAYSTVKIQTQPLLDLRSDTTIAKGTQIVLKNLLPAIGNYSYEWSSGQVTPSITVSTTDYYALRITYCNKVAFDSLIVNVVSVDTPKVDFTYSIDGCNPRRLYLKSLVSTNGTSVLDPIVRYQWIIDNGILLQGKDTVIDLAPGDHSVILAVSNAAGIERVKVKEVLMTADTWKINAVIDNLVAGWSCIDTAHVIATATTTNESYTISWNKPVVDRSFGRYIITYPGQYIVYLKDSCGNIRATDTLDINISEPLKVNVHQVKDTLYGSLSQYTTSINTTYTWKWYRNDTLLNGQTSSFIIPVKDGMYKAVVNSSNGCSVVSVPVNFIVQFYPQPKVVRYTYEISPCNRQIYSFKGSVSGIDAIAGYQWLVDNATWSGMNLTYELTSGTHLISFIVTDIHGDTTNWTSQITVQAALPWTVNIANETAAGSNTVILTANSSPAAAGYSWSTGDTTRIISVTKSGKYYVQVKDSCNTIRATDSIDIVITPHPEVIIPTDSTLSVTAGFSHNFNTDNIFTAELTLDNTGGRTTGLQPNEVISLGTVNSSNGNIVMDVKIPDSLACATNYTIRITASSPKDTTLWSKQFSIINQPAQPVITQRGDSLFTSGIYNWQWYKNNVAIDGATNANYRARANASYTVEARNGEGCNSKSSAVAVVITAVGEVTLGSNTAKVFPNPSAGQVNLQFSKPLQKTVTVKVFNLQGHVFYTGSTLQQLKSLDLTNLPKGFYMIELSGYGTKKVMNIILQ